MLSQAADTAESGGNCQALRPAGMAALSTQDVASSQLGTASTIPLRADEHDVANAGAGALLTASQAEGRKAQVIRFRL